MTTQIGALPRGRLAPALTATAAGAGVRAAALVAALAAAAALRWTQAHEGLLYPDAYQYLLMARGLLEDGRPVLPLGDGTHTLLPNADASLKPLFPALVATLHVLGASWLTAARLVTAVAAGAAVVLTGLLGARLTGSRVAGVAAAVLAAASPTASFWTGFAGPDALGVSLALGSALALTHRRARTGGALAALAALARPEVLLVAGAAAVAGLSVAAARRATVRASVAGLVTVALALLALRPPLGAPQGDALLAVALVPAAALAWRLAATHRAAATVAVAGCALAAVAAAAVGDGTALASWATRDWALLALAGAGAAVATVRPSSRPAIVALAGAAGLLGAAYWAKNPHVERYVALLVPLVALGAAFAVVAPRRALGASVAAAAVGALLLAPSPDPVARDAFAQVADELRRADLPPGTLVTAAPDAYGFLLRDRPVAPAEAGARGLILLDGAQRLYAPGLRARGTVVARLPTGDGFLRPDGTLDRRPALVVSGRVAAAGG